MLRGDLVGNRHQIAGPLDKLQARRDNETIDPELAGGRYKLVVVGIEIDSRWTGKGVELLRLFFSQSQGSPTYMARYVANSDGHDCVCIAGGVTSFLRVELGQDPR